VRERRKTWDRDKKGEGWFQDGGMGEVDAQALLRTYSEIRTVRSKIALLVEGRSESTISASRTRQKALLNHAV
jgi:hypothetical protein